MKNTHRSAGLAALLTAAVLALAGCGAGSGNSEAVSETMAAASADGIYTEAEAVMDAAGGTSASNQAIRTELSSASSDQTRKLIRNIYMNIETTDFDGLTEHINSQVSALGGYVESSETTGSSLTYSGTTRRNTYIKARVPADRLDQFVSDVEENGNVTNKSESTTDVTLQYSDIESHKKTLETEQERLWALLEKADTLDAVIALESRLSEIRYQLESYESQLRLYDNQVEYSTVELQVLEVQILTASSPDNLGTRISKGFSRSLANLSDGAVTLFVLVISISPYLVLLAVIGWIVLRVRRRILKASSDKSDSP